MIWFGKSFIKFCKSFINLIKLVSTRTCSSARVRMESMCNVITSNYQRFAVKYSGIIQWYILCGLDIQHEQYENDNPGIILHAKN